MRKGSNASAAVDLESPVVTGALVAGGLSLLFCLMATPWLIRALQIRGVGQPIHDAVTQHSYKAGTPTMGGIVIPAGAVLGYAGACIEAGTRPAEGVVAVLVAIVGGAVVGVVDDWLKVRRGRNLGLREVQKSSMQLLVILAFCVMYLAGPAACTYPSLTGCRSVPVDLGPVGWAVFAVAAIWVTSNAVNFTDGLEGLLSGSASVTYAALAVIGFWELRHPGQFHVTDAFQLTVVAAAMAAGCAGFLWWNGRQATIFMGDTGSLAIGMGVATMALCLHVALLIPVFGVLYAMEGASTTLQRVTYKWYFKPRGAKRRLFRMAPIHHHFELGGWSETTVLVRFWIISAMGAIASLAIFYGATVRR